MATGMTKAAQIMELWSTIPDGCKKTRQIADLVGCRTEYVRTVARQRQGAGTSNHDRTYLERVARSPTRYKRYRKRMREYMRNRYRTDPEFRAACLRSKARARLVARAHSQTGATT